MYEKVKRWNKDGERSRRLLKTSFFIPHCRQLQIAQRCVSHKCLPMCEMSWSHKHSESELLIWCIRINEKKSEEMSNNRISTSRSEESFCNGSLKRADLKPIRSFNCVTLIIDCYRNESLIAQHTQHLIFHMHEFSQAGEMKTTVKWWRTVDLIRLAQ